MDGSWTHNLQVIRQNSFRWATVLRTNRNPWTYPNHHVFPIPPTHGSERHLSNFCQTFGDVRKKSNALKNTLVGCWVMPRTTAQLCPNPQTGDCNSSKICWVIKRPDRHCGDDSLVDLSSGRQSCAICDHVDILHTFWRAKETCSVWSCSASDDHSIALRRSHVATIWTEVSAPKYGRVKKNIKPSLSLSLSLSRTFRSIILHYSCLWAITYSFFNTLVCHSLSIQCYRFQHFKFNVYCCLKYIFFCSGFTQ